MAAICRITDFSVEECIFRHLCVQTALCGWRTLSERDQGDLIKSMANGWSPAELKSATEFYDGRGAR